MYFLINSCAVAACRRRRRRLRGRLRGRQSSISKRTSLQFHAGAGSATIVGLIENRRTRFFRDLRPTAGGISCMSNASPFFVVASGTCNRKSKTCQRTVPRMEQCRGAGEEL